MARALPRGAPAERRPVLATIEDWIDRHSATSRRDFLKTSGMLVVSLGAAGLAGPLAAAAEAGGQTPAPGAGPYPDVDFRRLDSWIAVHEDNTATFYVGKTDGGQGTGTALRQMMASELDMPFDRTSLVMGRTDITVIKVLGLFLDHMQGNDVVGYLMAYPSLAHSGTSATPGSSFVVSFALVR